MSPFSNALQRWRKPVIALAIILALTVITVPGTLHAQNGNGNAFGKNKDYPYGVNQQSSRAYAIGLW